jgi:hypothetical protein
MIRMAMDEPPELLPPLAHVPALPGDEARERSVPGSIPELQVLRAPSQGAEPRPLDLLPDDGGWRCVAGLPAPRDEAALALRALDAWADGVAHQAQRCGRALDAARIKEILQENNAFSVPQTIVGLAAAAAATAAELRDGSGVDDEHAAGDDGDEEQRASDDLDPIDAPLTPPRSPKDQAESSETAEDGKSEELETDTKKSKNKSKSKSKTKKDKAARKGDKDKKTGKSTSKSKRKAAGSERAGDPADSREDMWIVASDEGWVGREASISRILEQHQLASEEEADAVVLTALRNKLREMTTSELQNEELNRPVHQPVARPGKSEAFRFHSEAYKVTPLALGAVGDAAALRSAVDELELAKKSCPRLNLLTPPQLVDLLHMTHPDELQELWYKLCRFDGLVYRQPPAVSSCSSAVAAVEVVAVRQQLPDGRNAILPLARAYPTANFAVPADYSVDVPPQADWIEGLFRLIAETQQLQLQRLRSQWPGQGRYLCDFLQQPQGKQPTGVGGADLCCMQVLLLALNLRVSEILRLEGELTVSGVELETTIDAETSIPRLADVALWEEAEELVREELSAVRGMTLASPQQADGRQGASALQNLIVRLVGLRCTLSRRDVTEMVRFREAAGGEVELSMLVPAPTSNGTSVTSWRGCFYSWELQLARNPLFTTSQTASILRTMFTGLSEVSSLEDALPDPTLQLPATIIDGPPGSGKVESVIDACHATFGVAFKLITADKVCSDSSELAVTARALAKFPVLLILDDANCISRSALEDAMAQPHLVPSKGIGGFSGFACSFNPEREDALHSEASMKRLVARNDTVALTVRPPDDMMVEYASFNIFSPCSDTAAFVAAAFFGSESGKQLCTIADLMSMKTMLSATVFSKDDDEAILATFRWLGREVTFASWKPDVDFTGCGAADMAGAWKRLADQTGEYVACQRYHTRLLASVYSKGAHLASVDRVVTEHVMTGRRFHAADAVALLCNYPQLVTKHQLIRLKPVAGGVAVGWPGTRNVPADYLAVHISGSGEGYHGPGALWAGKSVWGLLGRPIETEQQRDLSPMVLALDGALTTLELLPAVLHSSEAKELLTSPPTQAILAAKWKLLRLYWLLEFACFFVLFLMYVSHALLEGPVGRGVLLGFACVFTLPLFWVEWRQYDAVRAMRGVGASKALLRGEQNPFGSKLLVRHVRYFTMHNVGDLSGLCLVWVSALAALVTDPDDSVPADDSATAGLGSRSNSLVALAVLCLCIKLISYLKINTAMGFLVSVITTCAWSMRQFLIFMVVVIVVSGTTFQLQFAPLVMSPAPDSADTMAESTFGGAGAQGLMTSVWSSFVFTIMGEFNPEEIWAGGFATILFFVMITLLVNVVMLNILIAIVSDAFQQQHEQAEYISAKLTAETIFGIDSWFPRKRRAAFQIADGASENENANDIAEISDGEEFHNEVQYDRARADKLIVWEYKESLKCAMPQATLHVLSARASAELSQQTAAKLLEESELAKQGEGKAAEREAQQAREREHKEASAALQKAHEEQAAALIQAHKETKAELQAANDSRERATTEARRAMEATKIEAEEQVERATAEVAETQSRLSEELETMRKDLTAHKLGAEANAGEVAELEEAHAATQAALDEAKAAHEQSLADAKKELQIAQELAAEEQARVEAEAEKLREEKAELEGIAEQLRAEKEASTVKGRRKKKK